MTNGGWELLPLRARDLFGVRLGARELDLLRRYVDRLASWSYRMNLMSAADRDHVVDRHVLDSLSLVGFLEGVRRVADFGAGAGFPGIPVAVVLSGTEVHLVEARRKRCTFLRHVARMLALQNVQVWEGRGERWTPNRPLEAVVGRGIRTDQLAALARRVLAPGGKLLVMRKRGGPESEVVGFTETETLGYRLPGGEDHEVAVYDPACFT